MKISPTRLEHATSKKKVEWGIGNSNANRGEKMHKIYLLKLKDAKPPGHHGTLIKLNVNCVSYAGMLTALPRS